jgi:hypothetical protein
MGYVAVIAGELLEQEDRVCRPKPAKSQPKQIPLKPRRETVFASLG